MALDNAPRLRWRVLVHKTLNVATAQRPSSTRGTRAEAERKAPPPSLSVDISGFAPSSITEPVAIIRKKSISSSHPGTITTTKHHDPDTATGLLLPHSPGTCGHKRDSASGNIAPSPSMVSHSVAAGPSDFGRSSNRSKRTNRSHAGGSFNQPQNEFPIFGLSGDVDILLRVGQREQRYILHKLILSQCSGFFEAGTSQEWSRGDQEPEDGRPAGEQKKRWRYELEAAGGQDEDIPMLVQKVSVARRQSPGLFLIAESLSQSPTPTLFAGDHLPPQPPPMRSKPAPFHAGFFRTMANFSTIHIAPQAQPDQPALDTLRDYNNLFRIFYNFPPLLDAVNIAIAYVQCKSLLNLADMYDSLDVVGPKVDYFLLQFGAVLWKQIAKYPPSYLRLGFLARSKVIFQEALVHVVGQWPSGASHLRSTLPDHILDLIEEKVDELEDKKAKVEGKLFRLTLLTARGERVSPTNSFSDWMVVSLFRQWLAENTTAPPAPNPRDQPNPRRRGSSQAVPPALVPIPPNTGRIFRIIGTGGSGYLSHDEIKRFLKLRPDDYNRDSLKRSERRMEELKALAKEIVFPLMHNYLQLTIGKEGGSLGYLTCTKVEENDFPWDE
ncbi:MAG: hypothetical protein M1829_004452 [Trizodia sp. TS-e1964]|nr:MAG: hypothetical protein M1829_004452 [Trizodia sp. TS-e1964]